MPCLKINKKTCALHYVKGDGTVEINPIYNQARSSVEPIGAHLYTKVKAREPISSTTTGTDRNLPYADIPVYANSEEARRAAFEELEAARQESTRQSIE